MSKKQQYFNGNFLLAFNIIINDVRYPIFRHFNDGDPLISPLEMLKSVLSNQKMINTFDDFGGWYNIDVKVFPCFANLTDDNLLLGFHDESEIPQAIQALIGTSENISDIGNVTYQKVENKDNTVIIENMTYEDLEKVNYNPRDIYSYDNYTSQLYTDISYLTVNTVVMDYQGEVPTYVFDMVALFRDLIQATDIKNTEITDNYDYPNFNDNSIIFTTKYSVIPVYENQTEN